MNRVHVDETCTVLVYYDFTLLLGRVDQTALFCNSMDLKEGFHNPTAFCSCTGHHMSSRASSNEVTSQICDSFLEPWPAVDLSVGSCECYFTTHAYQQFQSVVLLLNFFLQII